MNETFIEARKFLSYSWAMMHTNIQSAIKASRPLNLEMLKEALTMEQHIPGTRVTVTNLLRREIKRQEKLK